MNRYILILDITVNGPTAIVADLTEQQALDLEDLPGVIGIFDLEYLEKVSHRFNYESIMQMDLHKE